MHASCSATKTTQLLYNAHCMFVFVVLFFFFVFCFWYNCLFVCFVMGCICSDGKMHKRFHNVLLLIIVIIIIKLQCRNKVTTSNLHAHCRGKQYAQLPRKIVSWYFGKIFIPYFSDYFSSSLSMSHASLTQKVGVSEMESKAYPPSCSPPPPHTPLPQPPPPPPKTLPLCTSTGSSFNSPQTQFINLGLQGRSCVKLMLIAVLRVQTVCFEARQQCDDLINDVLSPLGRGSPSLPLPPLPHLVGTLP